MKKKNKLYLGKTLLLISPFIFLPHIISCNKTVEKPQNQATLIFDQLSNKLKNSSIENQKYDIDSYLKYLKQDGFNFLEKNFDIQNLVSELTSLNYSISITNPKVIGQKLAFNLNLNNNEKYEETKSIEISLSNFKIKNSFNEFFQEVIKASSKWNIDVSQISTSDTAEDFIGNKIQKNSDIFKYVINSINNQDFSFNKSKECLEWKNAYIYVNWIRWNNDANDWNIKGKKLEISLRVEAFTKENNQNVLGSKSFILSFEIFKSYNEKFVLLKQNYEKKLKESNISFRFSQKNGKSNYSTRIFVNKWITENTSNFEKNQYLNNFFKNFSWNILLDKNDDGLKCFFKDLSYSKNENFITLKYVFNWKNKQDIIEVELSKCEFTSDEEYIQNFANNIKQIGLKAANITTKEPDINLTSEQIFNMTETNLNDLFKYVENLDSYTKQNFNIDIKNIRWDNTAAPKEQGKTLFTNLKLNFIKILSKENHEIIKSVDVNDVKVSGFMAQYDIYKLKFEKLIKNIEFNLTNEAKTIQTSRIDNSNILNYLKLNYPTQSEIATSEIIVSNPIFKSLGTNGSFNITITLSWTTKNNQNLKAGEKIVLTNTITKDLAGFASDANISKTNFENLKAKFMSTKIDPNGTSQYLNNLKKANINYSEWLPSYFAHDNKTDATRQDTLSKLFDLPAYDKSKRENDGLKLNVINVTYSENNSKLNDTQIEIEMSVTDINTNEKMTNKFIVSGLFDPFNDQIRTWMSKSDYSDFNNSSYKEYDKIPAKYKKGDANWQNSWVMTGWGGWGWNKPASYYEVGKRENNKNEQNNWVKFAQNEIQKDDFFNQNVLLEQCSWNNGGYLDGGEWNDGVYKCPTSIKIRWKTNAIDKHGNLATGKYKDRVSNWLNYWLYFKNRFWKE